MDAVFVDAAGRIVIGEHPPTGIHVDAHGRLVEGIGGGDAPTSAKAEMKRLVQEHIEALRIAGARDAAARLAS